MTFRPDAVHVADAPGLRNGFALDKETLELAIVAGGKIYGIKLKPEECLAMADALYEAYSMYVATGGLLAEPAGGSA